MMVLGNEERFMVLRQLSRGESCVSELEEKVDIHQPTLLQHCGVLCTEEVVNTRRDGKRIHYSVADPKLIQLREVLHRIYCPKD